MSQQGPDGQPQSGTKKPQLPEQQPDVVPRAAQHRVQRVADGALERISAQSPVHLHVPDRRLDGTPGPVGEIRVKKLPHRSNLIEAGSSESASPRV